jgi:hypothetical protein
MAIPVRDAFEHLKFISGAASAEEADALTKATSPSLPFGADFCGLTWVDGNVTELEYKVGGSGGTTVATISFGYTDGNVTSITKS